jgi:hypothetical protein
MGDRLCHPSVGRSHACPHRHILLSHVGRPEPVEDRFRSHVVEADQGRTVATASLMVLHCDDECLEFCEGKAIRENECYSVRMLTTMRIQCIFEWSRSCGVDKDFNLVRLPFCLDKDPLDDFKKGGNSRCQLRVAPF